VPTARSIVIPMFDEATRIRASIEALAASTLNRPGTELLLVDDGSRDGTAEIAEQALHDAHLKGRVIRLHKNLGKGAAVRAGVAASTGAVIAFSDADLSSPPDEIERVLELAEEGRAPVVIATRLHERSHITAKPPLARRYGGKGVNLLLRTLGLTSFADTQCGLKAFTRPAADLLFRDLVVHRFAFDVELLVRAEVAGLDVLEVPVEWRHVEASRVRPVRDGGRIVFDAIRLRRHRRHWIREQAPAADMPEERFDVMAELEREHWWFRAKRRLVLQSISSSSSNGRAADVGCGTGAMVADLAALGFDVVGTDMSPAALGHARAGSTGAGFLSSTAEHLPFATGAFDLLTSLDVVEHLDDDVAALQEYRRVVKPGGTVVLAVPAYRWAWSDHDVALGHRRRYTAPQLEAAATMAGLRVDRCSYFHSWLVPPALLLRRTPLRLLLKGAPEEASFVSPTINRLLGVVAGAERAVAQRTRVPFGLSILLVASRPEEPVPARSDATTNVAAA
jgi:glycosyltransferase involved in cell wall biosynthesis